MDKRFQAAYKQLNEQQKRAVDTIEGPVMVIAGPGTGKTQLLSTRVANIIRETDTAPANILCLTFTDNAARNMRERLETIIGQAAYHVAIHTFHSFGSDIINQYPDFFLERQLLQQIDELGRYELLKDIFQDLPHDNPLNVKVGDDFVFLKDTLDTISWLKQNGLTADELHIIITANQKFMTGIESLLAETFVTTASPKQLKHYQELLKHIQKQITGHHYFGFPEYAAECAAELQMAIEATSVEGRYAPAITAWRNAWCQKNADGSHVFKDAGRSLRKMHAVANVYAKLQQKMVAQGLYDFDDMIIEALRVVERNNEVRFDLQERYQYILVDEFQDTNKAQLRLLNSLGDNPVFEGRPNIMTVGDDNQAIYAFQGAEVSNMVAFAQQYRQPTLITLKDNYRSSDSILNSAFAVAGQITDRLESLLPDSHKQLIARVKYDHSTLRHNVFPSELAQYDWIAEQVSKLIKQGTAPEGIAIIAPRHRYLERLMPYLGQRQLPVAYERRENVLEAPIIVELLTMAALVLALADNRQADVDSLISRVLGYDFWGIEAEALLQISLDCYNKHLHWLPVLAKHKNKKIRDITAWLVRLAKRVSTEPLEYMLDELLGNYAEGIDNEYDKILLPKRRQEKFVSTMRAYYFSHEHYEQGTDGYLTLLGQLSSLRQRLRQWQPDQMLYLRDLTEFAELHRAAKLKIIDANPHTQNTNAVQVMTAYKAKGLEFDAVFVINAQDEVWGPTARHYSSRITLPRNLPLAPASDGDNDRLRLLFVALTRARHSLYVTSYTHDLDGKPSPGLSFIADEGRAGDFRPNLIDKPANTQAVEILSTDWAYRFRQVIADRPVLLQPVLEAYKLSVTHLNNFIDVRDAGPNYFLVHNLLRFPAAATPSAAYGDAIHQLLQWVYAELRHNGKLPRFTEIESHFINLLSRKHLRSADYRRLVQRGRDNLKQYFHKYGASITSKDIVERGFNNEGVVVNQARLSGKIDKLHFLDGNVIQVIDYKTGKPAKNWQGMDEYEKVKLYKYRQQLLFYKLLVENSASFRQKLSVKSGALEFIEPDDRGQLVANLELSFEADELTRFTRLIGSVWTHILQLKFPDISHYPKNLRGILQFEQDLLDNKI